MQRRQAITATAATAATWGATAVLPGAGALWAGLWPRPADAARGAGGQRHALLIGVSALARQPAALWLKGPAHDVVAMRKVLGGHGFLPQHITVLADGVAGTVAPSPDRAEVLKALQAQGRRLAPGDTVLLFWSGHGVRVAAPAALANEPDGQRTCLLTSDAARLPAGSAWPLQGAVSDAEIGQCVDDWLARGAHVVLAVDACHAASATRSSVPDLAWRGLRVADLQSLQPLPGSGLRTPAPASSGSPAHPSAHLSAHLSAQLPDQLPPARARPAGYIALLACESTQRTPEWRGPDGIVRGLFTSALCAALAPGGGSLPDYAALARGLTARSRQWAAAAGLPASGWPSPRFEGTLLAPLWTLVPQAPLRLDDAAAPPPAALPAGVRVRLASSLPGTPARSWDWARQPLLALGPLPVGAVLDLQLDNTSGLPVDVLLVHVDAAGVQTVLYPALAGDSTRFDAGTPRAPARLHRRFDITPGLSPALESLVLQVAPVPKDGLPREASPAVPPAWQARAGWQVTDAHPGARPPT